MKYCVPFGACLREYICSNYTFFILFALSLLLFVLISFLPLALEQWLALGILEGALLYLSLIDIKRRLLPDYIVMPLLWLGLILNAFGLFTSAEQALFGAVTGYVCLYAINGFYRLFMQQDGMGYGDVKLFSALGAWAGIQALPVILALAAGLGLLTFMVRGGLRWNMSSSITSTPANGGKTGIPMLSHDQCPATSLHTTSSSEKALEGRHHTVRHLSAMHGWEKSNRHIQPSEVQDLVRRNRGRKTVGSIDRGKESLQQKDVCQKRFKNENRYERHLRRHVLCKRECVIRRSDSNVSAPFEGTSALGKEGEQAYLKEGIPFGPSLASAGWGYLVVSTSGLNLPSFLFTNAFQ
ncbi:N-methyltransferase [Halomonadaceae bacterium LMG 33818]|uniref:prepilin peptidase n=1 Tax=Cernens ardua TaxID=3402176 RepID=UPI003EDBD17F